MIAHFFFPERFPLDEAKEVEIHERIKYWEGGEGELESFPKLFLYALENGFKVTYFLLGPWKRPSAIDEELWEKYLNNFYPPLEEAKKDPKFTLITDRCTIDDVIAEVGMGNPVICETKYEDFATHALIIRGWKGNLIYTIDSIQGYFPMSRKDLEKRMDLGYMKNFASFGKEKAQKEG
jgi:hypothetical protein